MTATPATVPHRLPLSRILAPQSVAVIGASDDVSKFGGRVLFHLLKHGFGGHIVPVNPKRDELFGLPVAHSIAEAGAVDVATIAVPPDQVVDTVAACAAAGVGAVVIITAQMAESGAAGATRQAAISAIARDSGMRLIGPNCLGFVNAPLRLALTASFAMGVDGLPAGDVGIVSQSGALMATMFNAGYDAGLGFSTLVSVGNQADVTEVEVFDALIEDGHSRAIALYLEGISSVRELFRLARKARQRGKAVVAIKAGRTEAGCAAALSHTASLAGPYSLFAAAAAESGMVLADDTEAGLLVAGALARWPQGIAAGRGIAVVSGSGGGTGILADRLADAGLPLARPGAETAATLSQVTSPGQALVPLDAGALKQASSLDGLRIALEALLADPGTGALVYLMTTQPQMRETAALLRDLERASGKPVLLILSAGSAAQELRSELRELRHIHCNTIDTGLRILSGLFQHAAFREGAAQTEKLPPQLAEAAARLAHGPLAFAELADIAEAAGLALPAAGLARTAEQAQALAAASGHRVVLKVAGEGIVHKSDEGGVILGLDSPAAVAEAFDTLRRRFGERFGGVLVQQQVAGGAELIVGAIHDAEHGPFVMVGAGGIHAEIFADTQTAVAPIDEATARALIGRLRILPLLAGARGRPRLDIDSAARAVAAVSRLIAAAGETLPEFEINPLIVAEDGKGSIAVDLRGRASRKDRP